MSTGSDEVDDDTIYAQGRLPDRTYASASFPIPWAASPDHGKPARFVWKVFDPREETVACLDGEQWVVSETAAGRSQVKLLVAREAGRVRELWIQRVPRSGEPGKIKTLLNLRGREAARLIELLRNLDYIPVDGGQTVRIDDALINELFTDPNSLKTLYRKRPGQLRQLISDDESARDVIALSHRRGQLRRFKRFLNDGSYFDSVVAETPGQRKEAVWQRFFEENPWILGVPLTGQLLTSWNNGKLEQVVAGTSVAGPGKRTDALLRTSGRIKSMVFAEIKTHRADLLGAEYRSGCFPPSTELAGGVAQVQGTVHRAVNQISERLPDVADDGSDVPGEFTYMLQPRAFLIIGHLDQLRGQAGGDHRDRIRSFELYRRQLHEPEIVTFDELLARAEWHVTAAENIVEDDR
ncbi:Shedu immune nuclease family protein [Amycolatopsis acidicola]|uniref:Shedu immune nuclease family protein n=1 Tax=Amycolatopsis acidicola TaxID=2596893 RepID=UPI001FB5962A|nr:Shedu immune nuclease family protein [Amycolatopsis acidicola]